MLSWYPVLSKHASYIIWTWMVFCGSLYHKLLILARMSWKCKRDLVYLRHYVCLVVHATYNYDYGIVFVTCRYVPVLWHVHTVYMPPSYPCCHGGRGNVLLSTRSLLRCWPAGACCQKCFCPLSWSQVFQFMFDDYKQIVFVVRRLGLTMINLWTKFAVLRIICLHMFQNYERQCNLQKWSGLR